MQFYTPIMNINNKRKKLTEQKKKEIIDFYKGNNHFTQRDMASRFHVSLGTINSVLNKDKVNIGNSKPRSLLKTGPIDNELLNWFIAKRSKNFIISGDDLKLMALKLTKLSDLPDFKASNEWLESFKFRHGISSKVLSGESIFVRESILSMPLK